MSQSQIQTAASYRSTFWRRVALAACVAAIVAYIFHDAYPVKNGGTTVGLALGAIAAAIICLLLTLGIRKRAYRSTLGSVHGWVSSHIYLGLSLLVIGTLHTGFQFGVNIHGAAWLLMCIVVATGIWGLYAYKRYPQLLNSNHQGESLDFKIAELNDYDQQLAANSSNFPEDIVRAIDSSIHGTEIGGGWRTQINGFDRSTVTLPDGRRATANAQQSKALHWLTTELSENRDKQRGSALKEAIEAITYRERMLAKIREHIAIKAKLKLWLIFHIPLSVALLAALIAHIFAVTVYV